MGEKEDEHQFAGKGSDDCMTISASVYSVSARTQRSGCHLASSKQVETGLRYVGTPEFAFEESIVNEFPIVEGIQPTRGITKDARLLDNEAVNGIKNSILSRNENRTLDAKGKVVTQSFGSTSQCNVSSRTGAKELTQNQEEKRKFRLFHITPKLIVIDSRPRFRNTVTDYQPIVASTSGWGSVCRSNNFPHTIAKKTGLKFPHCDRGLFISAETSPAEQTNHTSKPLCAVVVSEKPDRISERDLNKGTGGRKSFASTDRALVQTTDWNACAVHTHVRTLADTPNIEILPATTRIESENSTRFHPGVTDVSLTLAISSVLTHTCERPVHQDGRTSLRSSEAEMGNSPPRLSQVEETTADATKGKLSDTAVTPCANFGVAPECGQKNSKSAICKIPELIVSDATLDHELQVNSVNEEIQMREEKDTVQEDRDYQKSTNQGKPWLRAHKSSDSAYSSDSRCTSMDSASCIISRAQDDGDQDRSSLLSPPNATSDSKSPSSSSSSSTSSPSHSVVPCPPSDSTLRVMSDYGLQRKLSSSSGSSFRSSLSFEESEDDMLSSDGEISQMQATGRRPSKAQNSWTKIRRVIIWSPFMQSFKKKYPWVQLAGHAGNFQPGEEGCILKKYCAKEADCLSKISKDARLKQFAPLYHGVVDKDGERYTRMQDLLLAYDCPSVMDCKIGVRTYLEDELIKAKIKPRLRHDMYRKMMEISPNEPTPEEHEAKAVTKPRYMQWREHVSSSSNLGFRIEGIKKSDNEPSKDYKLTKTKEQIKKAFKYFINHKLDVLRKYIERLKDIRAAAERSEFFITHEVIGSSLLFIHDHTGIASAWMIDFGKTTRLPDNKRLTHREEWVEGNREDGYLFGLDNLVNMFEEIEHDLSACSPEENLIDKPSEPRLHDSITAWSLFSQSSGESFESTALESPTITTSDASFGEISPRKPPLRRQLAATDSYDDTPKTNGDANTVVVGVQNAADTNRSANEELKHLPGDQTSPSGDNADRSKT